MINSKECFKLSLSVNSLRIVNKILLENRVLADFVENSNSYEIALKKVNQWVKMTIKNNTTVRKFVSKDFIDIKLFNSLSWKDYALIRLYDYLKYEGQSFEDLNIPEKKSISRPLLNLWHATKYGKGVANDAFFKDFLQLLRQFNGRMELERPSRKDVSDWMSDHYNGLDDSFVEIRKANKTRIIKTIIEKIENGELKSAKFSFEGRLSKAKKFEMVNGWWDDYHFHLIFAARTPNMVNDFLDQSLRSETMDVLNDAHAAGIPIFINPYYLSLLSVNITPDKSAAEQSLRDYIFHSKELVSEFGNIKAWEKEDVVEPGKPNAAGWMLPSFHNVHRRYPEVAIFIPDTVGRACGGLCVSCQRMYDFQSGHLNFNLTRLSPKVSWPQKMEELLEYFECDPQLRDILITGGDSFMNSDRSLKNILDAVFRMAKRKKEANNDRPDGEKYSEMQRVRLGSRLLAYLPQRITHNFISILKDFKKKASSIGITQFVIQTHIQSAMEITPEVKRAINMILSTGWVITNQLVFTTASARRGHTAKLRKVLNNVGIVTYYTFSVKGFKENYHNFATNARLVQEINEEKIYGKIPKLEMEQLIKLGDNSTEARKLFKKIRNDNNLLFLSTDRSIMNLPGVGKSMTFRVIGITDDGRRILEFEHDHNRTHSPAVDTDKTVVIVESKSIRSFLNQMEDIGENKSDYRTIWGYTMNLTEEVMPIYKYPQYEFKLTDNFINLDTN